MKIKYFSWMAEQSFKTSPDGERLFYYLGGFWSKPYIIPDWETEQRLYKKQLWVLRIFVGVMILSQPFLIIAVPEIAKTPLYILYFIPVIFVYWLVNWLVFRKDLATLARAKTRIPLSYFYRDLAKRSNKFVLILVFLSSVGLVWAGVWIIKIPITPFVGWVTVIFFGFCAITSGYTLVLKLTMPKTNESIDNKTEA